MEGIAVGRIVHYRGSEWGYACKAAIIDHVHNPDTGLANLTVFPSMELEAAVRRTSIGNEGFVLGEDGPSWHWPERA